MVKGILLLFRSLTFIDRHLANSNCAVLSQADGVEARTVQGNLFSHREPSKKVGLCVGRPIAHDLHPDCSNKQTSILGIHMGQPGCLIQVTQSLCVEILFLLVDR